MVFMVFIIIYSTLAENHTEAKSEKNADVEIQLPQNFPKGQYTPHGYIDNPYHSMVYNRSGVIRSLPPLGFGFWNRKFLGSYAEGPRGHMNYLSLMQMSVNAGDIGLVESEDFEMQGIKLFSGYHTKNVMSYDWEFQEIQFSFKYFLAGENSLVCLIEVSNKSKSEKSFTLHATNIYGDWEVKWWGSDGLAYRYSKDINASVMKIWAYGDVFLLASDWVPTAYKATGSKQQWEKWIMDEDATSLTEFTVKGKGPLYSVHSYQVTIPANSYKSGFIYLCRGKNEEWARETLHKIKGQAAGMLKEQLIADEKFWNNCPKLAGDWPQEWRNGWVYDWETLRMNIRPPIGIFKHPWDAMQVHSPRLVLGETALDMLTYSYADPELAKTVIYGTFADALAPNIPCTREDGSVNMIGADGSECGTAPMWGFPFHAIQAIHAMTGDSLWVKNLYPYLKMYIEWWLKNRTDEEGWLHCNNSWESGQDGSRRFLVKGEGDPATFVRTVDVEASMAEAMIIMEKFCHIAGIPEDQKYWDTLADERIAHTRSMFVDGWFRDIDGRNDQPIIFEDFYDPIMLAPLTCGIATLSQIDAIRPKFKFFLENPRWLQWPPAVMAFSEAAWYANEHLMAAEAIANIAKRVYQRTDSRKIMFVSENELFAYRIPGIANEFWPISVRPAGGENYGWGAILPAFIIRNIIGYREFMPAGKNQFYLAPALPENFLVPGKSYGISDLSFRQFEFYLTYEIKKDKSLRISLSYTAPTGTKLIVSDQMEKVIDVSVASEPLNLLEFDGQNGQIFLIQFVDSN